MASPECSHRAVLGSSTFPQWVSARRRKASSQCEHQGLCEDCCSHGFWLQGQPGSVPKCRLCNHSSCSNPVPQSQGDTWADQSLLWTPALVRGFCRRAVQHCSIAAFLPSLSCGIKCIYVCFVPGLNLHCQGEMGIKPKRVSEMLGKQQHFWK